MHLTSSLGEVNEEEARIDGTSISLKDKNENNMSQKGGEHGRGRGRGERNF